ESGPPGVTPFGVRATETLAELLDRVRQREPRQVLDALVAKLPRHSKTYCRAVVDRHRLAVHAVGEERLRMQRVGHVDAFPELIERKEHRIARAGRDADELEHVRQPHAGPLGDERPALVARLMRNL